VKLSHQERRQRVPRRLHSHDERDKAGCPERLAIASHAQSSSTGERSDWPCAARLGDAGGRFDVALGSPFFFFFFRGKGGGRPPPPPLAAPAAIPGCVPNTVVVRRQWMCAVNVGATAVTACNVAVHFQKEEKDRFPIALREDRSQCAHERSCALRAGPQGWGCRVQRVLFEAFGRVRSAERRRGQPAVRLTVILKARSVKSNCWLGDGFG